jgi:hypothetical protein
LNSSDRYGREDHLAIGDHADDLTVVSIEHDFDVRVREHAREHPRETMAGHRLVGVGEIPVVPVGADGNAGNDRGVEL